jgi:signal transduction histidine kinase
MKMGFAQNSAETANLAKWNKLMKEPITEQSFRSACDLMQVIAKTDVNKSYELFTQYLPRIESTNNHWWLHVLLMAWGHAEESLDYFTKAEILYSHARANAEGHPHLYRESLVGTILLYLEWGKKDSLDKYIRISEAECRKSNDPENLSFTYTFKAMAGLDNRVTMDYYLKKAIQLAKNLPDKNALFTARYNYAVVFSQNNPEKEVDELESLLSLAQDSSLNHYPPKLYERTNFSFRNPVPSIYYNLMQVNLLLTDYSEAEKYAKLFYDLTITAHPQSIQAPYFNSEMAIVEAYTGKWKLAAEYLDKSREQFHLPEEKIPYISYFIAAGMMAEHKKEYEHASYYFKAALKRGNTRGLYLMPPEIYYAHALILTNNLAKANSVFDSLKSRMQQNKYAATGFYYYKYYAELLKAQHDYPGYAGALQTFYNIKDSLTSLSRYRAIHDVETKYHVREEQERIDRLKEEQAVTAANVHREKIFYTALIVLAAIIIMLLTLIMRYRQTRNRQKEALHQSRLKQMEEQQRIAVMQGMMEAEEKERYNIADQLHDEVGSMLSLASLNISSVVKQDRENRAAEKLSKAQDILSSVSASIRNLSHRLTPMIIEKYGFRKATEDLAETINLSEKLKLETIIIGFEDPNRHSISFLHNLYRIIQELLHNIIKHADASHALLELVEHEDQISLMIEDDGVGIGNFSSTDGKGLNTIQSKIKNLNGRIEISSKKDKGTIIVCEIPTTYENHYS